MKRDNNKRQKGFALLFELQSLLSRLSILAGITAVLAVVAVILYGVRSCSGDSVKAVVNDTINITPAQITAIKEIGEWEFLTVTDEEMADTTRRGIFSDDHLIRIYYGKMRIGINMHKVRPGWIEAAGDSITVRLPDVELLDEDFIDEARTQAFYESGKWDDNAREALYWQAYRAMRKRGMTKENKEKARENARQQFTQMMKAMGFGKTGIFFGQDK